MRNLGGSNEGAGGLHVTAVVKSLGENGVGRAYPFLRVLADDPTVDLCLVGWRSGGPHFPLLDALGCRIISLDGRAEASAAAAQLDQAVPPNTDLIHCFKNAANLAASAKVSQARGIPLVLDIDDWEVGFEVRTAANRNGWRAVARGARAAATLRKGLALEELSRTTPSAVSVNSRALQGLFGGRIIYTGVDAAAFPASDDAARRYRDSLGIPAAASVIGFPGTPHAHKGIDELIAAHSMVRERIPGTVLLVVGLTPSNAYWGPLKATPGVVATGYVATDEYPAVYAACDVVTLPQRALSEAQAQTPAKLLLAMAAARPVVATPVGDIADILGDGGRLVAPRDPSALADEVSALLSDAPLRAELGRVGRQRFQKAHTLDVLRTQLAELYAAARQTVDERPGVRPARR